MGFITSLGIHTDNLLVDLWENLQEVSVLPDEYLDRLDNVQTLAVFVFIFRKKTLCASASSNAFAGMHFPPELISWPQVGLRRNVAWSFLRSVTH